MKKQLMIAILLLGTVYFAHSQKMIDKMIEPNGQKVDMKLSFAGDIIIESWKNDYIELQVSVDINDNSYNDFYSININKNSNKIKIEEDVDFEGIKKEIGTKNLCNFNTEINYTIKVPENLKFDLETISGNIELIGCQGEMDIHSISGFVDYSIPQKHKAKIDLSTVTGDVYSNVKFDRALPKEISWVGTNHEVSLNGGDVPVELKTVSGDIFIRKY